MDEAKITTIYPGIPESFFDATTDEAAATAARYRLERPFVLAVGTVEPRKNLDTLLDAYQLLPGHLREAFDLVSAANALLFEFDIYDNQDEAFLDLEQRMELLDDTGIHRTDCPRWRS